MNNFLKASLRKLNGVIFRTKYTAPAPPTEYIPATLKDAIAVLIARISEEDIEKLKKNGAEGTHFALGLWCRNHWLWDPTSPLHQWFKKELKIGHGDDMSGILMESLVRYLRGKRIEAKRQAVKYHKFWLKQNIDPLTQEPILSEPL